MYKRQGPIGLFAIQCARVFGAKTVIAADLGEKKLSVARECGADYVIDSKEQDTVAAVAQITGGGMAVSYTHLDVYKRQTWERWCAM